MVIPVEISVNEKTIDTYAMIDSGATHSFVDSSFVTSNNIPLIEKSEPVEIFVIDGRPSSAGAITHQTKTMTLRINNHYENIDFSVTKLGKYPVILGISWLEKHDPHITWTCKSIDFHSEFCKKNCNRHIEISDIDFKIENKNQDDFMLYSVSTDNDKETPQIPVEYSEYLDVFSEKASEQLPPHRNYDHKIVLHTNTQPPFGPIYSLSELELKALRDYINENVAKGFIRHSTSPAGAPILFVKKKDGSLRLCVDYRGLNKITIKNRYPLPLIGELIDRLKTAKVFSKIDLRGAYNLVRIAEGDEWKTAFRTRYGHYEYRVMPFGLCNAPATFQHFINEVLSDCLDRFAVAYLDDILVFSPTIEEHVDHVKEILSRLRKFNLFAKLEKCQFHKSSVEFLGYIVSSKGITMDPAKIKAVQDWPAPKNIKDIQSFLGFANFYRRFIKDFSKIVTPITKLLRKDTKWDWNSEAQNSFELLKKTFTTAPILKYFDPTKPIVLETDASDFAIGGVLSQPSEDNLLYPVAYYSRKLQPAEINYEIYDKEMMAIVEAFKEWRAYLEGAQHQITVITDHKNLEYFLTTKTLNRRQSRWSELLGNYDFIIKYLPGKLNGKPDALSRRPDHFPKEGGDTPYKTAQMLLKPEQLIIAANEIVDTDLDKKISKAYLVDPIVSELITYLKDTSILRPRHIKKILGNYKYENGLVLYQNLIYVPDDPKIKLQIMKKYHDSHIAGHFGQAKTLELITRNYFWPRIRSYVNKYVSSCDQCNRCKPVRHKPYGQLQPLPIPKSPWTSISMDFIVSLPKSGEFTAILVIVDRLTKMAHFIPTINEVDAPMTAKLFLENIYKLHGLPNDIISDRGSIFTSNFWKELMNLIMIKTNMSTAFHPQSDGQTERVNQILEQYLRLYCDHLQDNWSELLPLAEFAYNNIQHSTTKISPFYANYGQHPRAIPSQLNLLQCKSPATIEFTSKLADLHKKMIRNIESASEQYAKSYNKKHLPDPNFPIGSKVWLIRKFIKTNRPSDKLDYTKLGPYEIKRKIGQRAYELNLPKTMKIHPVFHVSLLELVKENDIPGRTQEPPPPIIIDNNEEYEIENIIDSRLVRNKLEYLVHWNGYDISTRTWEPVSNLENAQKAINEFHEKYPNKPGIRRAHP